MLCRLLRTDNQRRRGNFWTRLMGLYCPGVMTVKLSVVAKVWTKVVGYKSSQVLEVTTCCPDPNLRDGAGKACCKGGFWQTR